MTKKIWRVTNFILGVGAILILLLLLKAKAVPLQA
jgi:hypothetical protein